MTNETDESTYTYDPLERRTYEIIAYNAVGRGSEINTFPAYRLTHSSVGQSGWSVGLMQWDFGQAGRRHKVDDLLDGYQAWSPTNSRFSDVEVASLSRRLQAPGQRGNALSDAEQSRLNTYLRSDAGREFVNELDREQIGYKWDNVGNPLSQIQWLQTLSRTDPAQAAEIIAMASKRFNQGETRGRELIRHLEANEMTSVGLSDWIETVSARAPASFNAIVSGRNNALAAVRLINDLELGNGRLSRAWRQELHTNENVGLTRGFNNSPEVQLFDGMMRNPSAGARILSHVDAGAPAQAVVISGINANAQLEMSRIEQTRTGDLTVESPSGDDFEVTPQGWNRNGVPMQVGAGEGLELGLEREAGPGGPPRRHRDVPERGPFVPPGHDHPAQEPPMGPGGPPAQGRRDPRDPDHPDHVMNQGEREQVRSLYAGQVVPLTDQQIDSTTVSGLADVRVSSLGTDNQQRPREGETLALQLGASGPQVQALQNHLRELGYRDLRGQPLGADGVFDGHTRQAVARFQDDMGLSPTGVADEATQRVAQASVQWQMERQRQTAQAYDLSGPEAGSDDSEQARRANEPVAGALAHTQPPIATVMAFSDPLHRHHPLYAQAQAQTQAAGYDFSEARLTQITEALVQGGFQTKGRPWDVQMHSDGKRLCFNDPNTVTGGRAMVDVTLPEPSIAAVVGKVDAADERTAAFMQEWQQQRATQARHGPMLG